MPRLKSSTLRVTENWIEMCLTEDRLISPDEHVAYKPLATPMPVPGRTTNDQAQTHETDLPTGNYDIDLKGKAIHLSGYQETSELWILRRLVRAFGKWISRAFSQYASVSRTHALSSAKRCGGTLATIKARNNSSRLQRGREYQAFQSNTVGNTGAAGGLAVSRSKDRRCFRERLHFTFASNSRKEQ